VLQARRGGSFVVEGFGVGPAKGQEPKAKSFLSIVDARRSKSSISDKDLAHFQAFAEMRRWRTVFSKRVKLTG